MQREEGGRRHQGRDRDGNAGRQGPRDFAAGAAELEEKLPRRGRALLALELQGVAQGAKFAPREFARTRQLSHVACGGRVLRLEGKLPGHQLPGDTGQCVHIVARVRRLVLQHLGTGVGGRQGPHSVRRIRDSFRLHLSRLDHEARQTKVDDLDLT